MRIRLELGLDEYLGEFLPVENAVLSTRQPWLALDEVDRPRTMPILTRKGAIQRGSLIAWTRQG